jgi:hypothetical protein
VLEQARAAVTKLGRAALIGEILQYIAEEGTLDDLTQPEISHARMLGLGTAG